MLRKRTLYDASSSFKKHALKLASDTESSIRLPFGLDAVEESRGQSAHLIELPEVIIAHVAEVLGTKSIVADAMQELTGKCSYGSIAQDAVAMIVNDIGTSGALPTEIAMIIAVGDTDWFADTKRWELLNLGWKQACERAGCLWGPGETAILEGIIEPGRVFLGGSAWGVVNPKERLLTGSKIAQGDAIVLVESSGIHANTITWGREIAANLPQGYLTKLSDGQTFGDALLTPTIIYVPFIEDLLYKSEIPLKYAVHITGGGWTCLLRPTATKPFRYVIEHLPEQRPIFEFLHRHGGIDDALAFHRLNMGAGFAFWVEEKYVESIIDISKMHTLNALYAGHVEYSEIQESQLHIKPKNLTYVRSA